MQDLQREIDKLKEEINTKQKETERLDKMKKRLFSIVSHDIKSPLGILVGFADVLMRHVEDTYKTEEDEQLKQIKGYLNDGKAKILSILEDLVNWVKIENGSVPFRAQTFDAKATAEKVTADLKPAASKKQIEIEVLGQGQTCFGDPNTVRVILKNLVENAIKYTNDGKVRISLDEKEETIVIKVADDGIGITAENLDGIFEANKEKVKPGTSGEQGIGLGLPVVQGFVALNSGSIDVESEVGKGTTVTLTFPSIETEEA